MESRVGHGARGSLSRWLDTGGTSSWWGYGLASEARTFEEDLALLEGQILAEHPERSGHLPRLPPRARGAGKPSPRIRTS